ncbi:hypothetical protein [Treponema pectinovorum]|uniref:hypothetical protein n=1 Tax=Treponema pectinovorum TaxID=164 RepID=UPI0011CBEA46|nr:hypothetical protein [Treponema pectinovorum]
MKFEKLFTSKNHLLFKMDGTQVPITEKMVKRIKWSEIEGAEEVYNEEFLAKLRDELKTLEEKGEFVFVECAYDKKAIPGQYNDAIKHASRRIKDCKSVIGFALPEQIACDVDVLKDFFEKISEKHPHYVYFSKTACNDEVVLY